MAYARPAKNIREMTATERAAHYAAVDAEVAKVSNAIAEDFKRRNRDTGCLLWDYL